MGICIPRKAVFILKQGPDFLAEHCLWITSVNTSCPGPLFTKNPGHAEPIILGRCSRHDRDKTILCRCSRHDRNKTIRSWPYLCLSKTASTSLERQLYDNGTTHVFDPLLVCFPRPLVRPLMRSTRLHSRCWRPHLRSCRFATRVKTT